MRIRSLLLLLVGLFILAPAQAQDFEWVDDYVQEGMDRWEIPGMAVAVVQDDEIVYAQGFGVRHLEEEGAVDENTLFGVASTTKAMTAGALAILVDEGKLAWDQPVVDYMPEFRLSDPWVTQNVTPRDLLTHQVGVGRLTGNRLRFLPDRERREVLKRLRHHEFEQPFREGYVYSNVMYSAAGELIPSVTDMSWDDFVMQRIFAPLGMERSNTSITMIGEGENAAWPHQEIDGEVQPIERRNFDNVGPSASVNTSVTEMAQWMRLQLGEPGMYEGERLISSEQVREMHSAQNPLTSANPYQEMVAYGLGWRLGEHRGERILQHGGATDGMNTNLVLLPGENSGVIIMTNTFNNFMHALGNEMLDELLGARGEADWLNIYWQNYQDQYDRTQARRDEIEATRQEDTEPTLALDEYTGTYVDSLYLNADVTIDDTGELSIQFWDDDDMTMTLEHWHYDTFRGHWQNEAMREKFVWFDMDDTGAISTLNVRWTLRPVLLQVGIYPTNYYREVAFERVD